MRGICTPETDKFKNFFALVQAEAKKHGAIFFPESGDSNDFEYGDLDGADLVGWVIQEAEADEFETIWKNDPHDSEALDAWYDESCFVRWEKDGEKIKNRFEF